MANDLGFGQKTRSKLDITTGFEKSRKVVTDDQDLDEAADRASQKSGFESREPTERVKRIRKSKEPSDHVYVRAPISAINRFKAMCNDTGESYGEALTRLMKSSGY
ncbi:hypothetical protein DYI37_19115 [Fulvimarina endophytica]|uniref:Uncharacterized protein n=1 Tax=Fulvimarina endophytica TaxID=2293836 RepID=A0A371WY05_9HYPH|nr:hypothetical protein [Fulvimarina endophytica]RFC61858.1 hypothetical protein DYI37_19115 [Fulvimarina endophytica]